MAAFILKDAKILYGGFDISGILNSVALNHQSELQDGSTFAQQTRVNIPGVMNSSIEVGGFFDDVLDPLLFEGVGQPITSIEAASVSPDGGAAGDVSYSMEVDVANFSPGASYGEIFAFSTTLQGNGPLIRGTLLENALKSSTAVGTGQDIGTLLSTEGLWAALHVTAVTGTSPTLDLLIESDVSGFSSPTTRITFAQMVAIGSQFLNVDGPITPDDLFRANWTIGGTSSPSFQIFVTVGKRLLIA